MTTNPLNIVPADEGIVIDFWHSLCNLSKNHNPTLNNDGARDIAANILRPKNKDFFYLSVNHQGPNVRTCTVNSEQSIVLPSLSVLASEAERPGSDILQLNAFADVDQQNIEQASQSVKIDGVTIDKNSVPNLNAFKVRTAPFLVIYPPLNLFSARPGPSSAVADGAYLVLQGFEAGSSHDIHFEGIINVPEDQDSLEYRTYNEDLTYKLKII